MKICQTLWCAHKDLLNELVRRLCYEYPDYLDRISTLFKSPFPVRDYTVDNVKFSYNRVFIYPKTRMLIRNLYPDSKVNGNETLSLFVDERKNQVLRSVYEYEEKVTISLLVGSPALIWRTSTGWRKKSMPHPAFSAGYMMICP